LTKNFYSTHNPRSGHLADGRPYGSYRQTRCPKSSATSIGLRSRTLATIVERISRSHPALTVAGATRIQHHCGTCGDRDATDFFCSALPAHIARPIRHRSSRFSRPAFFCRSFFWALLQANSCVRQLRGFCFPGSSPHTTWVPPTKQPLAATAVINNYPQPFASKTLAAGMSRPGGSSAALFQTWFCWPDSAIR